MTGGGGGAAVRSGTTRAPSSERIGSSTLLTPLCGWTSSPPRRACQGDGRGERARRCGGPGSLPHTASTMTAPTIEPMTPLGRNSSPSPAIRLASMPPTNEPIRPATNASPQLFRRLVRPRIIWATQPEARASVTMNRIRNIGSPRFEGRCSVRYAQRPSVRPEGEGRHGIAARTERLGDRMDHVRRVHVDHDRDVPRDRRSRGHRRRHVLRPRAGVRVQVRHDDVGLDPPDRRHHRGPRRLRAVQRRGVGPHRGGDRRRSSARSRTSPGCPTRRSRRSSSSRSTSR